MEPPLEIIRTSIARADLLAIASQQFGDMVKAVVDGDRRIMAIGAELHADEEAALLEDGRAKPHSGASTSTRTKPEIRSSSSIP